MKLGWLTNLENVVEERGRAVAIMHPGYNDLRQRQFKSLNEGCTQDLPSYCQLTAMRTNLTIHK